jgi:uridine phosphorylase
MARYFFDLHESDGTEIDEAGMELPDQAAAERRAIHTMGSIAHDRCVSIAANTAMCSAIAPPTRMATHQAPRGLPRLSRVVQVPLHQYAAVFEQPLVGNNMPSILENKDTLSPSVFQPAALLREARRQKNIVSTDVPAICILDPDGDIVRRLRQTGQSKRFDGWPCYHTELDTFMLGENAIGVVGCAVGAPFAVLVAEELFASGCRLLISVTSAGQIVPAGELPYFVIIDRALRDEGTSYHYAPPSEYGEARSFLVTRAAEALKQTKQRVTVGSSWTTDAPFRETAEAIEAARLKGVLAVEMEAAALYVFASATGASVLCLAHVTNTMGQTGQDFEKGEADGTADALTILEALVYKFCREDWC